MMTYMQPLTKEHDCTTWGWKQHLAQSAPQIVVAHTFAESFLHAWHYDAQQRGVVQSHGSHVPRLEKGIALVRPIQGPLASITHQNKVEIG